MRAVSKQAAHLPGPWIARNWSCHAPTTVMVQSTLCSVCDQIKELHPSTHSFRARVDVIAECSGNGERYEDGVAEANARLIAAAPDLARELAAVRDAVRGGPVDVKYDRVVTIGQRMMLGLDRIEAALAKAGL